MVAAVAVAAADSKAPSLMVVEEVMEAGVVRASVAVLAVLAVLAAASLLPVVMVVLALLVLEALLMEAALAPVEVLVLIMDQVPAVPAAQLVLALAATETSPGRWLEPGMAH